MGNLDFSANADQLKELAAYMASQINVPTIGIGGGYAPIGTIISYMGTTAPQDYLACDGSTKNIADYPQLADFFEAQFGSKNYFGGDGTTTFAVPDLQGEFLRGTGTNSHTNQGSGANVGVHQDGTEIPIDGANENAGVIYGSAKSTGFYSQNADHIENVLGRAVSSTRDIAGFGVLAIMRPTNTSVLYCIKAVVAGEVYSTEERVVGTWIDGKPIYQKTINDNSSHSFPANTTTDIPYPISDLDQIISCWGTFRGDSLPTSSFSGSTMNYHGEVIVGTNEIRFRLYRNGSAFTGSGIIITVQYTKTT